MKGVLGILGFFGRFAPQAMAAGVFLGLLVPPLAELLRPLLAPAVWLLLVLSLLRVDVGEVVGDLKRPLVPLLVTGWMAFAAPVLMAGILSFVDLRPGVEAGMILAAASASLFSTPVLGTMFGLRGALLLVVLIAGTLILPLSLPLVGLFLLGFETGTDPVDLMIRMLIFIASAIVAAAVLRRGMGDARMQAAAPVIDGLSVILLILFAVAIMDGLTLRFASDFWDTMGVTALSFAVYGGLIVVGGLAAHILLGGRDRRTALTVGFISGTRNLAIILAVLPADVDPDIPLFFAVGQFPIYIMPMILKPIFTRLLTAARG